MTIYTSRSPAECFQRCPRRRYWEYLYKGKGLQAIKRATPLTTGIAVHNGLEVLMRWLMKRDGSAKEALRGAIIAARKTQSDAFKSYAVKLKKAGGVISDDEKYVYHEQVALTDALLRGFAIKVLPHIARRYEVMIVEQEEQIQFTKDVIFESRIDAVLRDKLDDSIYVVNFKTANAVDERREKQISKEMQGLTESFALQNRLDRTEGGPARVSGVLHVFLIKGRRVRQKDKSGQRTGRYETYSPLIRGYRKELEGGYEYAHSWMKSKTSRPFYVWENEDVGGIAGWVRMLAHEEVQPELGDVLGRQLYVPLQQFKDREEIKSLMGQVYYQELKIAAITKGCLGHEIPMLDKFFPMHRHSCHYPTDCDFETLCFNPVRFREPMATGEFGWRVPHHKGEREATK